MSSRDCYRPVCFSAIILAAGGSSRFGSPKQLLTFDGEPLISRIIRVALTAGARRVVVVTGAAAEDVKLAAAINVSSCNHDSVLTAHNAKWQTGPGSSIRVGVEALLSDAQRNEHKHELVAILLCDQPLLTTQHLEHLLEHLANNIGTYQAVASQYDAMKPSLFGPPAVLTSRLLPDLLELEAPMGAKPLLSRLATSNSLGFVPWAEGLLDIDTPADALRLQASWSS